MLQDTEGKRGGTEIQSSLPAPSSRQGPLRPGLPLARPVATSLKHHQVALEVPAPHLLWLLGRAWGVALNPMPAPSGGRSSSGCQVSNFHCLRAAAGGSGGETRRDTLAGL